MGISGYEVCAASLMGPFLLVFPYSKALFTKFPQIPRVLACAFGVGAYLVPDPAQRLMTVSVGVIFGTISLALEIWNIGKLNDPVIVKSYATSYTLGLILSSISKFAFWTNNPIWPIMNKETGGWNGTGLIIGLIAALLTKVPVKKDVTGKEDDDDEKSTATAILLLC
ncbi:unnamed protein product [Ambrosiozyma monospora]|uniref:Unnamed protein product n=1 Tax=Ambrosiozyma monospora TaxID=43982 RepID=A0ACB5UB05_AMBMO|nr:unnamed protein product [Ambrosiozyma monospora]